MSKTRKKRKKKSKKKIRKNKIIYKESLFETIKKHLLIYITLIICIYILNRKMKKSFFNIISTLILVSFLGYITHFISHCVEWTKLYKKIKLPLKGNKYFDILADEVCKFFDFHRNIHHDTEVNKSIKNILLESINNAVFQGLGLLAVSFLLSKINYYIVIFWVILYVTVHNINLNIWKSWTHRDHHKNPLTNISFGFDLYDIIFETGYETEYRPDIAINIVLITILLYFGEDICKVFSNF